jgi:hypothetical protein
MSALNFEQMNESKPVYEKKESVIVYLPNKGSDGLTVTLLGDPINQNATTKQLEDGKQPGYLMYRWSGYQHTEVTKRGGPFTNSQGREVTPKSTPTLIALHSTNDEGDPIFLDKPLDKVRSTLLYEVHKDPGYFLFKNPSFWPAHYVDDFKANWNIKPALALRVFLHDKNTNLPIEDEKILVVDGGFYTATVSALRDGAIENELTKTGGYEFRRVTFSRVQDAGKTKPVVTAKAAGSKLYETAGFEHLKDYEYKYSFTEGDDRVFNVDSFDLQRQYLMDNYNITIPSSADIESGKYNK